MRKSQSLSREYVAPTLNNLSAAMGMPGQASDANRMAGLLEGRCTFAQVGLDLRIHANDTLETASGHASFAVPPKLTVAIMLEGDLDAALDGQPLAMTARCGPSGYLWVNREAATLERWTRAGQRVRKVTISVPLLALPTTTSDGCPGAPLVSPNDFADDLAVRHWQPSAQAIRYAEEILSADATSTTLDRFSSSIAALAIVRSALSLNENGSTLTEPPVLSTRDANRARAARDFVLEHIDGQLPIAEIARRNGMSVSTLQRLFKACFGTTVNEFIRTRRLELARLTLLEDGLTVGEAAYRAGYSSAANFSTAFQRTFGYPPSACLRN